MIRDSTRTFCQRIHRRCRVDGLNGETLGGTTCNAVRTPTISLLFVLTLCAGALCHGQPNQVEASESGFPVGTFKAELFTLPLMVEAAAEKTGSDTIPLELTIDSEGIVSATISHNGATGLLSGRIDRETFEVRLEIREGSFSVPLSPTVKLRFNYTQELRGWAFPGKADSRLMGISQSANGKMDDTFFQIDPNHGRPVVKGAWLMGMVQLSPADSLGSINLGGHDLVIDKSPQTPKKKKEPAAEPSSPPQLEGALSSTISGAIEAAMAEDDSLLIEMMKLPEMQTKLEEMAGDMRTLFSSDPNSLTWTIEILDPVSQAAGLSVRNPAHPSNEAGPVVDGEDSAGYLKLRDIYHVDTHDSEDRRDFHKNNKIQLNGARGGEFILVSKHRADTHRDGPAYERSRFTWSFSQDVSVLKAGEEFTAELSAKLDSAPLEDSLTPTISIIAASNTISTAVKWYLKDHAANQGGALLDIPIESPGYASFERPGPGVSVWQPDISRTVSVRKSLPSPSNGSQGVVAFIVRIAAYTRGSIDNCHYEVVYVYGVVPGAAASDAGQPVAASSPNAGSAGVFSPGGHGQISLGRGHEPAGMPGPPSVVHRDREGGDPGEPREANRTGEPRTIVIDHPEERRTMPDLPHDLTETINPQRQLHAKKLPVHVAEEPAPTPDVQPVRVVSAPRFSVGDALKMSVHLIPADLRADLDGDGEITAADARLIREAEVKSSR